MFSTAFCRRHVDTFPLQNHKTVVLFEKLMLDQPYLPITRVGSSTIASATPGRFMLRYAVSSAQLNGGPNTWTFGQPTIEKASENATQNLETTTFKGMAD